MGTALQQHPIIPSNLINRTPGTMRGHFKLSSSRHIIQRQETEQVSDQKPLPACFLFSPKEDGTKPGQRECSLGTTTTTKNKIKEAAVLQRCISIFEQSWYILQWCS
jgi:hypothetical protein